MKKDEHLIADLRRDARKLGVVGKGGQVFNSLQERRRSNTAPASVLFRKICIRALKPDLALIFRRLDILQRSRLSVDLKMKQSHTQHFDRSGS